MHNIYVTWPVKIDHVNAKNHRFLACLLYHNLINYLHYYNEIFITTAEFSGLSSAAYENGILYSEHKILAKI